MEVKYDYHQLSKQYLGLEQILKKRIPSQYHDKTKANFEIELLSPIDPEARTELLTSIVTQIKNDEKDTKLLSLKSKIDPTRTFTYASLLGIDDLKKFELPFGLRDLMKDVVFPENTLKVTKYIHFVEESITAAAKTYANEKQQMYSVERRREFFNSYYEEIANIGWVGLVESHAQKLKEINKKSNSPVELTEKEWFIEGLLMVFLASTKVAYSGFIKEIYMKHILLTSPLVYNGDILVYQTNLDGDGMGIDFMLYHTNKKEWKSVAITNTDLEKVNCDCDLCFAIGKEPRIRKANVHYLGSNDVNANYWIYLPISPGKVDNLIA